MTTPAGWYPDPSGAGGRRYFDGTNWTDHQPVASVRRRRVWPWILAGVLLLFVGGCGVFLVIERSSFSSAIGPRLRTDNPRDPVVDGSLRFRVTSVDKASLQRDPQPKGVYYLAGVIVTNTGGEPRSFVARNQNLIDAAGRGYPAMSVYVPSSKQDTMSVVIDTGQAVEMVLRIDGPKESKVTAVELHESATSAGARVRI